MHFTRKKIAKELEKEAIPATGEEMLEEYKKIKSGQIKFPSFYLIKETRKTIILPQHSPACIGGFVIEHAKEKDECRPFGYTVVISEYSNFETGESPVLKVLKKTIPNDRLNELLKDVKGGKCEERERKMRFYLKEKQLQSRLDVKMLAGLWSAGFFMALILTMCALIYTNVI
ncbi:hypothetical protein NEFER03_1960 [Nematocida sp. LUAm3]|nr:hypothetical protein NEFER03_1960 [Nematocida sp. LUAm3]KAI5176044.1 hypothetical protein NEFER02_1878 [Nematocida sp. LUAm2]KAI5177088.1 hypothetical protein NEFER01_0363 [Nematocida sp. LUAm1]